jgi:hypothetical protein
VRPRDVLDEFDSEHRLPLPKAWERDLDLRYESMRVCAQISSLCRYLRESSDNSRLNAFCRVVPSLRLRLLAIFLAGVLRRAAAFNSRPSVLAEERRFQFLLAT